MKPIIYIDGQNFLYKAADVLIAAGRIEQKQDLHTFGFARLFESLMKTSEIEIRYYGTKLRRYTEPPDLAAKSKTMLDSQRKLRNNLASQSVRFVESGKLKVRDGDMCKHCGQQDPHFQEKGVDVRLASDMITDAFRNTTDTFVLVSSDTDLLPPIKIVRELGGKVIYVGFGDKLTHALSQNASETQVIRDPELIDAFDFSNPQITIDDAQEE